MCGIYGRIYHITGGSIFKQCLECKLYLKEK